jgi:hypothetical protein
MAALSLQKTFSKKSRLAGLPHTSSDHQKVIGQSMVYQITALPEGFEQAIRRLLDRDVLPVYRHDLPIPPSFPRKSLTDELASFRSLILSCSKNLPFKLLFQLEALVRNGYLLPWTVSDLLRRMIKFSEATTRTALNKDFPISIEAIKKLFSQIPFPGLENDASTFGVNELWQYIEENEKELRQGFTKDLISEKGRQNLTMIHKVRNHGCDAPAREAEVSPRWPLKPCPHTLSPTAPPFSRVIH